MEQPAEKIYILDTTLRDGSQGEGINLSLYDKLGVAMLLDNLGVDFIEAGAPMSNPKDAEFFSRVGDAKLETSKIAAFGSTRKKDSKCEDDAHLKAVLDSGAEFVTIVGKCSAFQTEQVLKATREENLAMIADTVKYLREKGRTVFFDAEHFFDGFKEDEVYALSCLAAAKGAGAAEIVLCDTNGGAQPDEAAAAVREVCSILDGVRVGVHFHNDSGLAAANSLMAVKAGARSVQGTFLGTGERCGNTNLSTLIPTLQLKCGFDVVPENSLPLFTRTAHHIAELCNTTVRSDAPYVGASAFTHKGGMHIDGVIKDRATFEHVDPASVGNERRLLISEVAGRSAIKARLKEIDPSLAERDGSVDRLLDKLKKLEFEGYQYESASASFELMALREFGLLDDYFTLLSYKTIGERSVEAGRRSSLAVVKVEVKGEQALCAFEGDGPVHALDKSLRNALARFFPLLSKAHLVDYKVRVIEPQEATAAKVRVLIDTTDGETQWTTVGVSADIIDASFKAITDSVVYMLHKNGRAE